MFDNLTRNGLRDAACWLAGLTLMAGVAGCRVNVNKGANGEDKSVQVDTPFGGVHVNTNQTTAKDLGLPAYPGAKVVTDDDEHKSADVHLGFGEWELRVRVVPYSTSDSGDQVLAFYKKALGRYGDVITCQDNAPVGTPTSTSEGLTCEADKDSKVKTHVDISADKGELQLMAGSKRHQHIVEVKAPKNGTTRFALVALDLPSGATGSSGKSD